jgi:ABC-type sugar transport system substrate-binding protein
MKKQRFLVSLTTSDNDYQIEQAASAEETARRLGVEVSIIYAGNDSILQSQQLLKVIQSLVTHTDGIIFEPAGGTALPQVARAAAAAGIAWVVLNRDAEYLAELRAAHHVPLFAVTSDHEEIGRIQGRQIAALLPQEGSILYVTGPSESLAAKQRTAGMLAAKPAGVQVKTIKAQWTEVSAHRAISAWLRLSTSQQTPIDLIAGQDDSMAMGARKAFQELPDREGRERWLKLPFLGCDGLPKTGLAWAKQGLLAATVVIPPNTGQALEMLVKALNGSTSLPERVLTMASSFPPVETLAAGQRAKTHASAGRG